MTRLGYAVWKGTKDLVGAVLVIAVVFAVVACALGIVYAFRAHIWLGILVLLFVIWVTAVAIRYSDNGW